MKLEDAIKKIVEEALTSKLAEARTSDPIVDEASGAIAEALLQTLEHEDGVIASNAFEMMMGSSPDEDRLTLARFEDVDSTAELIVQAVYRDPALHDAMHGMAAMILRNAMHAMGK
jgi:hypothetical protein